MKTKPIKKCYEYTYGYNWKELDFQLKSDPLRSICYADTPEKAKAIATNFVKEFLVKFDYTKLRVRRHPTYDLFENQNKHELLSKISDEQLTKMKHACGVVKEKQKTFTRNYFQIEHDEDWEMLIELGVANKRKALSLNYYFLTDVGLDIINSTQLKYKHEL